MEIANVPMVDKHLNLTHLEDDGRLLVVVLITRFLSLMVVVILLVGGITRVEKPPRILFLFEVGC